MENENKQISLEENKKGETCESKKCCHCMYHVFSIVSLIGVIVLFILYFTGKSSCGRRKKSGNSSMVIGLCKFRYHYGALRPCSGPEDKN